MLAGILQKLLFSNKQLVEKWKVLIITSRPTETREQWEAVFKDHADFKALKSEVKVVSRQSFNKASWQKIVS